MRKIPKRSAGRITLAIETETRSSSWVLMKKVEAALPQHLHFLWEIGGKPSVEESPEVLGRRPWRGEGWHGRVGRGLLDDDDISAVSVYAVVTFSPAPVTCWVSKEGREMVGMMLAWGFAGHLWQKATGMRKLTQLWKWSFMGWRGKELDETGVLEGEIKRSRCCGSWGLRAIYVCVPPTRTHPLTRCMS